MDPPPSDAGCRRFPLQRSRVFWNTEPLLRNGERKVSDEFSLRPTRDPSAHRRKLTHDAKRPSGHPRLRRPKGALCFTRHPCVAQGPSWLGHQMHRSARRRPIHQPTAQQAASAPSPSLRTGSVTSRPPQDAQSEQTLCAGVNPRFNSAPQRGQHPFTPQGLIRVKWREGLSREAYEPGWQALPPALHIGHSAAVQVSGVICMRENIGMRPNFTLPALRSTRRTTPATLPPAALTR